MGGVIIIERHIKIFKILYMFLAYFCHKFFGWNVFGLRFQHNRRAMTIAAANVKTLMTVHLLKSDPNVSLNIFNQMSQMNGAIGIGEAGGDKYVTFAHRLLTFL